MLENRSRLHHWYSIWCVVWTNTTTRFSFGASSTEIEGNNLTVCAGGRATVACCLLWWSWNCWIWLDLRRAPASSLKARWPFLLKRPRCLYRSLGYEQMSRPWIGTSLAEQGFKAERDYLNRKLKAFRQPMSAAKTLSASRERSRKRTSDSQEQPILEKKFKYHLRPLAKTFQKYLKIRLNSRKTGQTYSWPFLLFAKWQNHKLFDKYTVKKKKM